MSVLSFRPHLNAQKDVESFFSGNKEFYSKSNYISHKQMAFSYVGIQLLYRLPLGSESSTKVCHLGLQSYARKPLPVHVSSWLFSPCFLFIRYYFASTSRSLNSRLRAWRLRLHVANTDSGAWWQHL